MSSAFDIVPAEDGYGGDIQLFSDPETVYHYSVFGSIAEAVSGADSR